MIVIKGREKEHCLPKEAEKYLYLNLEHAWDKKVT